MKFLDSILIFCLAIWTLREAWKSSGDIRALEESYDKYEPIPAVITGFDQTTKRGDMVSPILTYQDGGETSELLYPLQSPLGTYEIGQQVSFITLYSEHKSEKGHACPLILGDHSVRDMLVKKRTARLCMGVLYLLFSIVLVLVKVL